MAQHRIRRKPMAQINVVPYIDVMLVLLVIFMVTAPMMQQGVSVDLPQTESQPVTEEPTEQIVIAVDVQGRFFLDEDGPDAVPMSAQALTNRIADLLRERKDKQVYVRGDAGVPYGRVVEAMAALQAAGAESIGLITEQPSGER
jgi:biopolymer transport protein TolR